jgi:hypothetical protein
MKLAEKALRISPAFAAFLKEGHSAGLCPASFSKGGWGGINAASFLTFIFGQDKKSSDRPLPLRSNLVFCLHSRLRQRKIIRAALKF